MTVRPPSDIIECVRCGHRMGLEDRAHYNAYTSRYAIARCPKCDDYRGFRYVRIKEV